MIFNCIQPINIKSDGYIDLLLSDSNIKMFKKNSSSSFNLEWIREFGDKNHIFDYLLPLKTKNIDINLLKKEFNNKYEIFSEFLDLEYTKYELLFDFKFLYFILVYEIRFYFPILQIETLLNKENNLYTKIRTLLVKETDDAQVSIWADMIRKESLKTVSMIAKSICGKFNENNVSIKNNTGNITSTIYDRNFLQNNKIENFFVTCNQMSERLQVSSLTPIYTDEQVSYSFNGRFHTIIIKNRNDYSRYMPIQFQMQFLWYLLNQYNIMMDKLNVELLDKKNQKNLEKQNNLIDELINKIEMLLMYNENFSRAIELDNDLIYKKVEKKWNIFNSLDSSKNYITFFKDYLERTYTKKISKAQKKQNNILFVISLIQVIALVSIWNDYLSLLDEKSIKNVDEILFLFNGEINNLMLFNGIMPLGLSVILLIALFYMVLKK